MFLYFISNSDLQSCSVLLISHSSKCYENKMDYASDGWELKIKRKLRIDLSQTHAQQKWRFHPKKVIQPNVCMHWSFSRSPKWVTVSILRDYCVTFPCWKRDEICMYLYSIPGVKFRCVCVCVGHEWFRTFQFYFAVTTELSTRSKVLRTLNYNKRKKKTRKVSFE